MKSSLKSETLTCGVISRVVDGGCARYNQVMIPDPILERSRRRRAYIEVHKTSSFAEAEAWDLAYWQARTPEQRLEAYMALREDVEKVEAARPAPRSRP